MDVARSQFEVREVLRQRGEGLRRSASPHATRFVYPIFEETTARAIEACEAAWAFFGGVFRVLIPDNTKAIIVDTEPLAPRITPAFLEYAQARRLHIDPARVRSPRDKGASSGRCRRPR